MPPNAVVFIKLYTVNSIIEQPDLTVHMFFKFACVLLFQEFFHLLNKKLLNTILNWILDYTENDSHI